MNRRMDALKQSVSVAVLTACVLAQSGCFERRLKVTSNPTGALVILNDEEVGRTPVEVGFKHYGTYDVRISLDDHEPIATGRKAVQPWYGYPPIDFIVMALPWRVVDEQEWHFDLQPRLEDRPGGDEDSVLERAGSMRQDLQGSGPSSPSD